MRLGAFIAVAWTIVVALHSFSFSVSLQDGGPAAEADPRTPEGKRIYTTQRLVSAPPEIDGILTDECWTEGPWSGGYIQNMPHESDAPSQETELKILYDDRNIYVAIRAYDTEPGRIDRKLGRRDAFEGDIVGVCFDSYFDHRTGFEFDLTAAGAKMDLILKNQGWDTSWDAVWYGAVGSEPSAWTAEMRIPLSQLRYSDQDVQVWGLHAWRWINRNREEDQWNLIRRDGPGPLYSMGELHGINGLSKSRRVELLPYVSGKVTSSPDFFDSAAKRADWTGSAGLDGKLGLSSAFTLDFTVNPDFGQVEVDPSILNITAFETFYEEKRPFFLEGKNIFDFELGEDLLFYSRRIGEAPRYEPALDSESEYLRTPTSTSILGALKLTGKTAGGLSVGVIDGITSKESAEIISSTGSRNEVVAPFSNYAVGRIQQDLNGSNTIVGGMFTSTHRGIDDPHLEFLPADATTGGLDFRHHWKDKTYFFNAKTLFSDVRGSQESILQLQEASSRYFQRPDADHVELDPSRTSLQGHGGEVQVGKGANGPWRFRESVSWRSPGLELNDLGYLPLADTVNQETAAAYVSTEPGWIFREYTLELEQQAQWDFSGEFLRPVFSGGTEVVFNNKWAAAAQLARIGDSLDTRLQRGGPAVKLLGFWSGNFALHSDTSRAVSLQLHYHSHRFDDGESRFHSVSPGARFRISNPLLFSTSVDYSLNRDIFQYVERTDFEGNRRDLVGDIDQKTLGLTFRLDFAITPEFTIQYYGNPYVSTGVYSRFKRFTNPRAEDFSQRYHVFEGEEVFYDSDERRYYFDESGDGQFDYSIANPDFNFREFRSNLVARWEYTPGSVLYVVWTQGRSLFEGVTNESLGHNLGNLFDTPAENVFLVKLNYWLPF
jgi:hypothetical protein